MSQCVKCNRRLPPNGTCQYCGGEKFQEFTGTVRRRSNVAYYVKGAVKLALAAGTLALAYWLIFTDGGNKAVEGIRGKLGLEATSRATTPALELLAKHPKVAAWIDDRSVTITEELLASQVKQVSLTRRAGDRLETWTYRVDLRTNVVTPLDEGARKSLTK